MAIAIPFTQRTDILNLATAGQWTTITLPGVPAGATGVIVDFYGNTNNTNAEGAIRTIGCGLDGNAAYQLGSNGSGNQVNNSQCWAEMDGSNQVEMWVNANCIAAQIVGWLEDNDVTFLPTCQDMWGFLESGDQSTPWSDHVFDLSSISGGAGAALVVTFGSGLDGNAKYNWKRPAESYWGEDPRRGRTSTSFVYPLDGSGKVTFKFSHHDVAMVVLGFMGSNFTSYTGSMESNLITGAGWGEVQLNNTSQTATVAVIDHDTPGSVWGGIQAVNEPPRQVADFWGHGSQYFVGLDGSKRYQHHFIDAIHENTYTRTVGWFDPASAPTVPTITNVNGTDTIVDGTIFTINGTFPTTITGVKTIDGALETTCGINSQTATAISCNAYDAFSGDARLGAVDIEVTDGVDTDTISITILPHVNYQYVTLADPLITDGVNKGTTSVDGDQIALAQVSNVSTTMYDDADVRFDPATPNGTAIERRAHDGSTWNADTAVIYRGSFTGVSWTGTPNPPNAVIGTQYDYYFGGFVSGDRPITYTLETGQLPEGLVIDSTAETITGIATEANSFTGISILADNGGAALSVQVEGDDV